MFPTTLFTRRRPATLQPSDDCSWMRSDQCSWTHYAPLRVRTQQEGKDEKNKKRKDSHLLNPPGATEAPPLPRVRFADRIARVAASALGGFSAKARAAIVGLAVLVQLVEVVVELPVLRTRDSRSCSRETSFDDVVGNVALELAGYVRQVEGQYCAQIGSVSWGGAGRRRVAAGYEGHSGGESEATHGSMVLLGTSR